MFLSVTFIGILILLRKSSLRSLSRFFTCMKMKERLLLTCNKRTNKLPTFHFNQYKIIMMCFDITGASSEYTRNEIIITTDPQQNILKNDTIYVY